MHLSALDKARVFRAAYLSGLGGTALTILDVGSAVVDATQRSNRDVMQNPAWTLIGLDIEPGPNVDVVVADPYDWTEIATSSVDVVTCSEVFEHAEYVWVTILEISRVLKPNGLAFVTSPSSGPLHRFPIDCWRFYDDGLPALARYARLNILEAQVQWAPVYRKGVQWRDASIVLQKPLLPEAAAAAASLRITMGKLMLKEDLSPADLLAFGAEGGAGEPSAIPRRDGLGAFAAREAKLAQTISTSGQKAHLVLRHLREIARIVRTPLLDLRF